MLSEAIRGKLLSLAKESIAYYLDHRDYLPAGFTETELSEKRGVFVTLHKHDNLRGCIGLIEAVKPLGEAVIEMAVSAAFHDHRFTPVNIGELAQLSFEISVISPFRRVRDVAEIEVGRHGLMIRKGGQSGLLLPQVATEYGWEREEFLRHTCLKAQLPPDAWKSGADISLFEAEVFH